VRWTPRFQHLSANERDYSALGGQTRNNLNG
jgi:bisphosphoglycerate-dependent phosphoglycerate mutase